MNNREMPPLPLPPVEKSAGEVEQAPKESVVESVVPKLKPVQKILVVAIRDGFYKQRRKSVGSKFDWVARELDELGSWVKCVDPVMQAKFEAVLSQRKEKSKAGK